MKSESNLEIPISSVNDEINLKFVFNSLKRNKGILISISLISFLLACVYSLTQRRTWEGQFQIVLDNDKNNSFIQSNLPIRFRGISQNNSLRTQVGILKSPSLLNPIYEFVLSRKKESNQ